MIDKSLPTGSKRPVIVSACLLGLKTRYNAEAAVNYEASIAIDALKDAGVNILAVCPEQIGGLSTPREPASISGGSGLDVLQNKARVIDIKGLDVTSAFIRGAEAVLNLARTTGACKAIFKERSPSCGLSFICSTGAAAEEEVSEDKKNNNIIEGCGVTTALLLMEGLQVQGF